MLNELLQRIDGIIPINQAEHCNTTNILPFKIPDRYSEPQPMPFVLWKYSDYEFNDVYQRTVECGIEHNKLLAQTLYEAGKYGNGNGYIVEIGTSYGHGTCILASGSKAKQREKVITVDNDRGERRSLYSNEFWERQPMECLRFTMNCLMMGVHDWVIPIGASSQWVSQNLNIKVRVLYIDGNHEYNGCAGDIILWKDKVISGGLIILHDYDEPAVKQAIDDYIVKSDEFTDIIAVDYQTILCQKRGK